MLDDFVNKGCRVNYIVEKYKISRGRFYHIKDRYKFMGDVELKALGASDELIKGLKG